MSSEKDKNILFPRKDISKELVNNQYEKRLYLQNYLKKTKKSYKSFAS